MVRSVVVGAAGYAGAEAVGLLLHHPGVDVVGLFASEKHGRQSPAQQFANLFPRFRGMTEMLVCAADVGAIAALEPDVVFLATPHEVSHQFAPELLHLQPSPVVIDLSAAFRFKDASDLKRLYGIANDDSRTRELLQQAVYGLPEINRDSLRTADLIAAPGCYPTSAILALHPLMRAGAIAPGWTPIIDSTSGVSGAGRAPVLTSSFCEVSLQPYNVLAHRHEPEIALHAGTPVIFTPHLGAFDRGILSTIHIRLAAGWTKRKVDELLHDAYGAEALIRLLPGGQWPSIAAVERTCFCDLGWAVDETRRHMIIVSAIDNLLKGAAGQAVQCMNIRFGFSEIAALLQETRCPLHHM
jgi:N-acetyl-gamma-glutamyl-phosphate reductase